jgi:hypothetical protein
MNTFIQSFWTDLIGYARDCWEAAWRPVSKVALIAWLVFYAIFLLHAFTDKTGFLIVDHVNFIVHEAGHLLFGWFGSTIGLWGGTLLELLVPFLLAIYFFTQRHATGVAFSIFFFFENFLYIAVYMADARAQELPLLTVGSSGEAMHDWFMILSSLGLLQHDTALAATVKIAGWIGMFGIVAWLARRWD